VYLHNIMYLFAYVGLLYLYISSMQNMRDNVNLKWLADPELDTDFDHIHYKYVSRIKPIGIYCTACVVHLFMYIIYVYYMYSNNIII